MKKALWIILIVLIIGRLIIPPIALRAINNFLADFSPIFYMHIDEFDLRLWKAAARIEGFQIRLREQKEPFLKVEATEISAAWREIFAGRFRTDVVVIGSHLRVSNELFDAIKKYQKKATEDAKRLGKKMSPIQVDRIDIHKSTVRFASAPGIPDELLFGLSALDGRITNITSTPERPISVIKFHGTLPDSSELIFHGYLNSQEKPAEWRMSTELEKFHLKNLNPLTSKLIPLTFTAGTMDLYAEAKGEKNQVEGYAKPFVKDLAVIGNKKDFKSAKHLGIEALTAVADVIFRKSEDKTVATKINFSYKDKKFKWDPGDVASKAAAHGFKDEIKPGLEHKYKLEEKKDHE